MLNMWYFIYIFIIFLGIYLVRSQYLDCHDDILYQPEEGIMDELQFTWLGLLQYIHVKDGNPHYFRVPRVVLISRQYVLSTAVDAAQVPKDYALGNVVFGEYERDEEECGIRPEDTLTEGQCQPAILIVPLLDVLLHPEYNSFGAPNSIALLKLLKPVQSAYMLPVCLPLKDFVTVDRVTKHNLWHVDFGSNTPRQYDSEEKELTKLFLLPKEMCFYNKVTKNNSNFDNKDRQFCTTDCSFHSGAPTIIHEHTGHWTVVSISEGSVPCQDPYRQRTEGPPPSRHIALYPYVPWITSAITGKEISTYSYNEKDPFGFTLSRRSEYPDSLKKNKQRGWIGHWWLAGLRCFDRGDLAKDIFRFYHESFMISMDRKPNLTYFLEINSKDETKIVCLKVGSGIAIGQPKCWHINTQSVHLRIPVRPLAGNLKFFVEAWAVSTAGEKKKEVVSGDSKTISTSEEP